MVTRCEDTTCQTVAMTRCEYIMSSNKSLSRNISLQVGRTLRPQTVQPTTDQWITCHIGAFCFGAFHFGDFHFDAVPVRRVSLWRASTSARFSLARFHFGALLFGAFPNCVSMLMHNRLFDHLFPFCACFLRRSVVYASFAAKPLY